jgi:hypothetical protein
MAEHSNWLDLCVAGVTLVINKLVNTWNMHVLVNTHLRSVKRKRYY